MTNQTNETTATCADRSAFSTDSAAAPVPDPFTLPHDDDPSPAVHKDISPENAVPTAPTGPACIGKHFIVKENHREHVVEVLNWRTREKGSQVYIHKEGRDSRLDKWILESSLLRVHKALGKRSEGTAGAGRTRKRKHSQRGAHLHSHHAPKAAPGETLDAAAVEHQQQWEALSRSMEHGKGHGEHTKVRNIHAVQFGRHVIDCWYYSPYPREFSDTKKLLVCEQCFKYTQSRAVFREHVAECTMSEPPGRLIYADEKRNLYVYEVDGAKERMYGQNVCLFGKLFIEHKTLYFDPEPFHFYILVEKHPEHISSSSSSRSRKSNNNTNKNNTNSTNNNNVSGISSLQPGIQQQQQQHGVQTTVSPPVVTPAVVTMQTTVSAGISSTNPTTTSISQSTASTASAQLRMRGSSMNSPTTTQTNVMANRPLAAAANPPRLGSGVQHTGGAMTATATHSNIQHPLNRQLANSPARTLTKQSCQPAPRMRCRPVGYFSKEKDSQEGYNLACILVLPQHQRKGYGKFIISLSYELSKLQNMVGSPEKPLSDLGKLSYRSYWTFEILRMLDEAKCNITVDDISKGTGIRVDDIISTLETLKLLRFLKGQYVMVVSEPRVKQLLQKFLDRKFSKSFCYPELLTWVPIVEAATVKEKAK